MTDENTEAHKIYCWYKDNGEYVISFDDDIFNSVLNVISLEKILQDFLKPEKYDSMGSWCGMSGFFIKDNIKVDTFWDDMFDYNWIIDTNDDAVKNKVYEWAVRLSDEYLKQSGTNG